MIEGLDTLINIEEKWSICDLADAHEALDIRAEMQHHAAEANR